MPIRFHVTSRWVEPNGFERQRFSIGRVLLEDRKVTMPDSRTPRPAKRFTHRTYRPTPLEYMYRYNQDWRFTSTFNWDPDSHSTRSGSAMWHYQPADNPGKIVNLGYRYRNDTMRFDRRPVNGPMAATTARRARRSTSRTTTRSTSTTSRSSGRWSRNGASSPAGSMTTAAAAP